MKRMLPLLAVVTFLCFHNAFSQKMKKVVLIAGVKTHGPGEHEYIKTVKLLKLMLDHAPKLKGIKTEVHFNGWPADPSTLDDADAILVYADGSDDKEDHDPLLVGDHWQVIEKQMNRGCGLILLHYSTFVPKRFAPQALKWVGGYFDYENGKPGASGSDAWFSAIKTETALITPLTSNPVCTGIKPFELRDEYYYNIHFAEGQQRLWPAVVASIPGIDKPQEVAWTIQRADGGRGFGFTGGHFFSNFEVAGYRKLLLNAIVWTAHGRIPDDGVESFNYTEEEVEAVK